MRTFYSDGVEKSYLCKLFWCKVVERFALLSELFQLFGAGAKNPLVKIKPAGRARHWHEIVPTRL